MRHERWIKDYGNHGCNILYYYDISNNVRPDRSAYSYTHSNGFRMSHILTPSLALAVASILGSVGLNMTEWKALLYCARVSIALLLRMS